MNFRDLQYILSIAENKSISKAAEKLLVSQPSLSQCLKKVESELDITIFTRTGSGVAQTDEGAIFLEFARASVQQRQDVEKRLKDIKEDKSGKIAIGLSGHQATYFLPHFLPQFKERYPRIDIELIENTSFNIEQMLIKGAIDVGIIHPPVETENLEYFELSHDQMVIVPRSTSRYQQHIYYRENDSRPYLDLAFLQDEPMVFTAPRQRSRVICDQIFLRAGIVPQILQVSVSLAALDALAQVDYATVLLPQKQLSAELRRRSYFYIDPNYAPDYPFYVVYQKDTYHSRALDHLLEYLRSIQNQF